MSTRSPASRNPPPNDSSNSRLSVKWLALSIIVACGVGGLAIVGFELSRESTRTAPPLVEIGNKSSDAAPAAESPVESHAEAAAAANLAGANLIDDDGSTLWVSPTSGRPLDLAYLPPGSQLVVALRPAALTKNREGAKALAALGPLGQWAIEYIEDASKVQFDKIDALLISCQATGNDWLVAMVVHPTTSISQDQFVADLADTEAQGDGALKYWISGNRSYYLPPQHGGRVLVVAPPALMRDVIELAGATPPLRRDLERLLASTDADRQLTLLVAPNFLFSDGQSLFRGEMIRLRGALFWFFGDTLSAAALSLHWDENFFAELLAMPTLDVSAETTAKELLQRVRQMPDLLEAHVLKLTPQLYGRRVVARFPEMVRKLASYTRGGVEGKNCAVLRCYLPDVAGHNLILGTELVLAESAGAGMRVAASTQGAQADRPAADVTTRQGARERLARTTSLSFERESLETALEQLSQDIGVEMVVVGPDLQADGITRNQQLGIHIENRPAADILVAILRSANPDKTATGASDRRQKLVYVVKPKSPGGPEAVFITTRARAAERNEALPEVFRETAK